ncbi:MAG: TetR/AcrR family transcriptional regulator, partial [Candidatus Dormibacteraeota bacterium]|nr:TetR/AcrR family transcriptional regulator [Candidatus Dormibacteraeota bacterium]
MTDDRARVTPLRELHRQDTRRHIVAAARDLFQTGGYTSTTMEAVAERAGVSRATLFNYFPSKQSLLLPFAGHLMQTRVRPEVEAALEPWPGLPSALAAAIQSMERHIFSLPDLRDGLREALLSDSRTGREPRAANHGNLVQEILERAASRGELRRDLPVTEIARFVTLLLVSDRLARDEE